MLGGNVPGLDLDETAQSQNHDHDQVLSPKFAETIQSLAARIVDGKCASGRFGACRAMHRARFPEAAVRCRQVTGS
jgi:hypothetical protein